MKCTRCLKMCICNRRYQSTLYYYATEQCLFDPLFHFWCVASRVLQEKYLLFVYQDGGLNIGYCFKMRNRSYFIFVFILLKSARQIYMKKRAQPKYTGCHRKVLQITTFCWCVAIYQDEPLSVPQDYSETPVFSVTINLFHLCAAHFNRLLLKHSQKNLLTEKYLNIKTYTYV